MAPARSSTRRGAHPSSASHHEATHDLQNDDQNAAKLFLDPNFGTPLQIYVEKDVEDKDLVCQLIQKHGGTVSPGYSRVTVAYILVDPHKVSGQNLFKQYTGKECKIVLDARWVNECIKANALLTYQTSWGGCKVTGSETVYAQRQASETTPTSRPIPSIHHQPLQPAIPTVDPLAYQFQIYPPIQPTPRQLHSAGPAAWHPIGSQPLAPTASTSQPHIIQRLPPPPPGSQPQDQPFREGPWEGYHSPEDISAHPNYDYSRYREDQNGWVPSDPYYGAPYDHSYGQPAYMDDQPDHSSGANSVTGPAPLSLPAPSTQAEVPEPERPRGRKRTRPQAQPPPAVPASSLVVNRNPPARSPTPPTRVIKSTYGGNLFTSDDVMYLKKYIDYCQEQGLVLSLREICERIAIKAPHHTFYSWRRYCNKHKIKLGGYMMNNNSSEMPLGDDSIDMNVDGDTTPAPSSQMVESPAGHAGVRLDMAVARAAAETAQQRPRSPSPPRSLFRSTTGKGVAFTQEDVNFLMRFMAYRKSQGSLDLVAFWREVAAKAPHHSRASWMKFWRRHKHELDWEDGDDPLPPPPDKKLRYSKEDDVLLAKYFFVNKSDGKTSDKVFQAFGRLHPHHPWKGWQEHHRIHRATIDQLIQRLAGGENIDERDGEEA